MPLLGYERGADDACFGRIRSKGAHALFCGHNTMEMKARLGVKDNRPLADFLPTLTIAAIAIRILTLGSFDTSTADVTELCPLVWYCILVIIVFKQEDCKK